MGKAEREAMVNDPNAETCLVLHYDILCATKRLYGYTPSWALQWDYRKELILNEILQHNADFLCLQEVDNAQYEEYFSKQLAQHDYEGAHWAKSRYKMMSENERRMVDGSAIFYKASK